ncbi:MAG TPA: MFS transporter [Dehalococcoidia bacterium]|nr:MFS transporter [Dehalococcoidia bacterium]
MDGERRNTGRTVFPLRRGEGLALAGTFSALRVHNYRLYWGGQAISLTGTWMQNTAQGWLVTTLTPSPVALGTAVMLQFLPIGLLSLPAGVLADRLPKKQLLLALQTIAMAQATAIGVLVATDTVRLWHVYLLAFVLGTVNAFSNPTRQALIPELVPGEKVPNAVALYSAVFNLARVLGPAVAGLSIATIGLESAFLLNAASFVPVLAGLLLMRDQEMYAAPRKAPAPMLAEVWEGLVYAFRTPAVFQVVILMAFIGTFGYNYRTMLPLLARQVLHVGSQEFGLMDTAVGLGAIAAALVVAYRQRASEGQMLLGAAAFSAMLALLGLSYWYGISLLILAGMGLAGITFTTSANARLQLLSPPEMRGRIMSLYTLLFAGTTPIGSMTLGLVADTVGVQGAVLSFAALCGLGVALALLYRLGRRATAAAMSDAP